MPDYTAHEDDEMFFSKDSLLFKVSEDRGRHDLLEPLVDLYLVHFSPGHKKGDVTYDFYKQSVGDAIAEKVLCWEPTFIVALRTLLFELCMSQIPDDPEIDDEE